MSLVQALAIYPGPRFREFLSAELDVTSGGARLSYRRAAELFEQHTESGPVPRAATGA